MSWHLADIDTDGGHVRFWGYARECRLMTLSDSRGGRYHFAAIAGGLLAPASGKRDEASA